MLKSTVIKIFCTYYAVIFELNMCTKPLHRRLWAPVTVLPKRNEIWLFKVNCRNQTESNFHTVQSNVISFLSSLISPEQTLLSVTAKILHNGSFFLVTKKSPPNKTNHTKTRWPVTIANVVKLISARVHEENHRVVNVPSGGWVTNNTVALAVSLIWSDRCRTGKVQN